MTSYVEDRGETSASKNVEISVMPVKSDDYGDTTWCYYAVWRKNGKEVYSDYFRKKPSQNELGRIFESVVADNEAIGDYSDEV